MKACTKCKTFKDEDLFGDNKAFRDGKQCWCKQCAKEYIDSALNDPRKRMHWSSYINARNKGLEHTITIQDIPLPTTCKYLGITLDYRRAGERGRLRSNDAPSIDRIDPQRGYTPNNIQVISDLANKMKQNASVEQLLAFAEGVMRVHGAEVWAPCPPEEDWTPFNPTD